MSDQATIECESLRGLVERLRQENAGMRVALGVIATITGEESQDPERDLARCHVIAAEVDTAVWGDIAFKALVAVAGEVSSGIRPTGGADSWLPWPVVAQVHQALCIPINARDPGWLAPETIQQLKRLIGREDA